MGIFSGLKSEGLEETRDSLGGFSALESNAYTGEIKLAYAVKSPGGAQGVFVEFDFNGTKFSTIEWVTNKKGENWFLNKNDQTKKVPLPGFTIIDDLCIVTTEKPLEEQATEEKVVKVYDWDQKKEIPQNMPVLVDLIGKKVTLGIIKQIEDAQKKNQTTGEYENTGKTREVNVIDKVFHYPTNLTVPEVRNATKAGVAPEASFHPAWVERNAGKTKDRSSGSDAAGKSGKPGSKATPPAPGGGERKSLFGGG